MKRTFLFICLACGMTQAQSNLRAPEKEHFLLALHLDYPKTLNNPENPKERGIEYNLEVGIRGAVGNLIGMEAKLGYDNFPQLYGGYEAFTGSFGLRLVSGYEEEWNYYLGFRGAKVYRTSERLGRAYRVNPALEISVTRNLIDNVDIGFRYLLEGANDQDIFDWEVEHRHSVYFSIIYKPFEL